MLRITIAVVAVAIAAIAASPAPPSGALQYEEISRFAIEPATPPPPGAFQDDRAAVMAAASQPAPSHHGLFGGLMNGVDQAMNAAQSLRTGFLTRYTYYNDWIRIDDINGQTALIVKCNQRQYIELDLARRTYRITSTLPPPSHPAPNVAAPQEPQASSGGEPGTMDVTFTGARQSLGPRRIEGVATQGESASLTVAATNATGSCRSGSFSLNFVEYVSDVMVPRAYCPLPRANVPSNPQEYIGRTSGCSPRMHENVSGIAMMGGAVARGARLAMYRLMSIAGDPSQGRAFETVIEAGNVRWLGASEAQDLFSIPAGFTQQQ